MTVCASRSLIAVVLAAVFCLLPALAFGQDSVTVLAGAQLTQVVPQGFYFLGRTAPVQMRNAAAARFGKDRHVIAGLVDTAGYAADVREKYEGFLITDSPVKIGGLDLGTGAYGFGFTNDGKFIVMDVGGKDVLSTTAATDKDLKRPRPLMMSKSKTGVLLYSGRNYVTIAAN